MRRSLLGFIAVALANLCTGCSSESDKAKEAAEKTKQAIERVLKADEKMSSVVKNLQAHTPPSQLAAAIGTYCDAAEKMESSDCPADFRVAYRQHMRAWRDAQVAVKQLPEDFLEGVFTGLLNAILRGETDGGGKRLEGDLKNAIERVRTTWEEVEKIGAKYGAIV
jgi:hypothetical protein